MQPVNKWIFDHTINLLKTWTSLSYNLTVLPRGPKVTPRMDAVLLQKDTGVAGDNLQIFGFKQF